MYCQKCKNTRCGFTKITKDHFNQFHNTMNYFNHNKSMLNAKCHAKRKLTHYLAGALGVCPNIITNRVLATIRKSSDS